MKHSIYSDDKKYIQRIRELREDHDYTQEYVAYYLHTSQTMYARYERDSSAMPIRHLYFLAKLYDVSTDYILGFTDKKQPLSTLNAAEAESAASQQNKRFGFQWRESSERNNVIDIRRRR